MSFPDLTVVPGKIFPAKFKMPDLTAKYDGSGDPYIHLRVYIDELGPCATDEKLRVHLFSKSLIGAALRWFVRLDKTKVATWDDLTKTFYQHYRYNTDIAPTRQSLEKIRKKPSESFREYAHHWREIGS